MNHSPEFLDAASYQSWRPAMKIGDSRVVTAYESGGAPPLSHSRETLEERNDFIWRWLTVCKLSDLRSMNKPSSIAAGRRFYFMILAILFLLTLTVGAATPQAPARKQSYDSFRLVQTRNIFDPERRPNAGGAPPQQAAPSGADYVALTGIMMTTEKTLAFFSGSRPEYSKVLSVSGTIAGTTVTKIATANIEVERDKKTITVAVGQTVPLDGSVPVAAPVPTISTPSTSGSGVPLISGLPSDKEALLRRMMERRQQELK